MEEGDYDVQVPIHDATEIGYAAAGSNRMVAGLRERGGCGTCSVATSGRTSPAGRLEGLDAGIGVSFGTVVAGNVGTPARYL